VSNNGTRIRIGHDESEARKGGVRAYGEQEPLQGFLVCSSVKTAILLRCAYKNQQLGTADGILPFANEQGILKREESGDKNADRCLRLLNAAMLVSWPEGRILPKNDDSIHVSRQGYSFWPYPWTVSVCDFSGRRIWSGMSVLRCKPNTGRAWRCAFYFNLAAFDLGYDQPGFGQRTPHKVMNAFISLVRIL